MKTSFLSQLKSDHLRPKISLRRNPTQPANKTITRYIPTNFANKRRKSSLVRTILFFFLGAPFTGGTFTSSMGFAVYGRYWKNMLASCRMHNRLLIPSLLFLEYSVPLTVRTSFNHNSTSGGFNGRGYFPHFARMILSFPL